MRGESFSLDELALLGQELGLRKAKKKKKRKSQKGMLSGFDKAEDCPLAMMISQMNKSGYKTLVCPFRNAPKRTRCERPDKGKFKQCG